MKLIYCFKCRDIRRLNGKTPVTCNCGESSGRYLDDRNAELSGFAVPVGILNSTFETALSMRNFEMRNSKEDRGVSFFAFFIPDSSEYIKYVKKI